MVTETGVEIREVPAPVPGRNQVLVRAPSYPIIGVNSFRNPHSGDTPQKIELIRPTEEEK